MSGRWKFSPSRIQTLTAHNVNRREILVQDSAETVQVRSRAVLTNCLKFETSVLYLKEASTKWVQTFRLRDGTRLYFRNSALF